jgi:hypothetical protein
LLQYFLDILRTSYLGNQNKQINQIPNKKSVQIKKKKVIKKHDFFLSCKSITDVSKKRNWTFCLCFKFDYQISNSYNLMKLKIILSNWELTE